MKLFTTKQSSAVSFLLTLLILFGTYSTGYGQAKDPPPTDENSAPVFSEGDRATRTVAENTAPGTNIGAAFTATDPDNGDTLTYSLFRGDKNAFRIDPKTGQLQTKDPLDYETKNAYNSLAVRATDSSGLTDAILVTINVTDVNEIPTFKSSGRSRFVAENTPPGTNIGKPFTATDPDGDSLTYSMYSGEDRKAFSIVSTTGQIQTKDALDYETKNTYSFIISVSDGKGGVVVRLATINVTDVTEIDPPLSKRTQQVQDAIVAAVPDVSNPDDVTPAHLAGITELALIGSGITSLKIGDFSGLTALTQLELRNDSISDRSPLEDISPLEDLTELTTLYLSNNSISDISVLEDLTKLTYLSLDGNSISDISVLEDLTELTYLGLSNNSISDTPPLEGISPLKDLTELTYLVLSNNSISDISVLEDLTKLIWLSLEGNPISDYGPLRRLKAAIQEAGKFLFLDITIPEEGAAPSAQVSSVIPDDTALLTNFPNPFNPETWIPYQLAKPADVTLTIYDIRGVVVRELKLGHQTAGVYHSRSRAIHWDGRNNIGEQVATGVYFYTLKAGDFNATRKLLIRK